jgi:hypothetical protein
MVHKFDFEFFIKFSLYILLFFLILTNFNFF